MATFTIPLKSVIDLTGATPEDYTPIGLGTYPLFDPDYRAELNQKIVDHYWNREIGMETIDLFKLAMRRKMNEVMPYYNKLYMSERVKYDMLSTMDITTKATSTTIEENLANSTNVTETDSTSGSRSVQSSTPQTMLSGNEDYAESAADVNSTGNNNTNSTQNSDNSGNSNVNADSHVSGYQGIPANIIMAYRASLLNIDLMVIADLEECFMLVWDTGDEYSTMSTDFYSGYVRF